MEISIYFKFLQLLNILLTELIGLLNTKLDKSMEVKFEHPQNILFKFVTFWVLKLETSNEVKEEQKKMLIPLN